MKTKSGSHYRRPPDRGVSPGRRRNGTRWCARPAPGVRAVDRLI